MKKTGKIADLEVLTKLDVVVDILLLREQFSAYSSPVKKIHDLAKEHFLSPLKRGLYMNLKSSDFKLSQPETLAQSIYAPSYISLEWALQFYGLLTDRVISITSVTPLKGVKFQTPKGHFSFEHINKNRYSFGYQLSEQNFFIARPEKALLDYINLRAYKVKWSNAEDIDDFLEYDVRLKTNKLLNLVSAEEFEEHLPYYNRNSNEARILRHLISLKRKSK